MNLNQFPPVDRHTWLAAVENETKCRSNLHLENIEGQSRQQVLASWWKSLEELLDCYSQLAERGVPPELPPGVVTALKGVVGYLATGNVPQLIRDTTTEGGNRPGPSERADILAAVIYHHAATHGFEVDGGLIKVLDRHPTKTIADAFQLRASTVRKWKAKYVPVLPEGAITEQALRERMLSAGASYRKRGRPSHAFNRPGRALRD